MALNSTGAISLGGSTTGQSVAVELGQSATAAISLNDSAVRTLAGAVSGAISMSSLRGKSSSGSQSYTSPGTYSWVAPAGVTKVSVVAVGGGGGGATQGGGGGGGLGYKNNITVTPGNSYIVVVGNGGNGSYLCHYSYGCSTNGEQSYFSSVCTVRAGGGVKGNNNSSNSGVCGGTYTGDGGGNGGKGSGYGVNRACLGGTAVASGGGGAGGYSGNGGNGYNNGDARSSYYRPGVPVTNGAGGGGGGGYGGWFTGGMNYDYGGGGGGGVGIFGQGSNGTAAYSYGGGGAGGSSGSAGSNANAYGYGNGGGYGGGGGGGGGVYEAGCWPVANYLVWGGSGGSGAVRIVWPGDTRQFPSTSVGSP